MAKVLLVDDDEHLIANIALSLELDNHVVDKVFDGAGAIDRLRFYSYDLVVLDLGLPDRSGLDVLSELRSNRNDTPVIILTGQNALKDKECGLDRGADDYVTKPVDLRELKARIRAILRRMAGSLSPLLVSGDLVFDPASADVKVHGRSVSMMPQELAVLEFLMRNKGKVYSAETLLRCVWHDQKDSSIAAVRQSILRLRKKIAATGHPQVVKTVTGIGYKVEDD